MEGSALASGETYVALSRCPSVEHISLARPLTEGNINISENPFFSLSRPSFFVVEIHDSR